MKILVVDDHELIRKALHGVLKELKRDVIVLEAVDSRQAMQHLSEQADIGLILLDLSLPDRDGFSVLSELRERHPAISVVVLSARQDRDSVVKALDLGALGFIPKSGQARGNAECSTAGVCRWHLYSARNPRAGRPLSSQPHADSRCC